MTAVRVIPILADEDFDARILAGLSRRIVSIDVATVQDLNLRGRTDSSVLEAAYQLGRILVSHDARTMPIHAMSRTESGIPHAGLCIVPQSLPVGVAIEELAIVLECSYQEEWPDRIIWLPL